MSVLSPADVVTLAGFVAVLLGWGVIATIRGARAESPPEIMRRRALAQARPYRPAEEEGGGAANALLSRPLMDENAWKAALATLRERIDEFAGPTGLRWLLAAALAGGALAAFGVILAGLPLILLPLVVPGQAVLAAIATYLILRGRFHRRFVEGFPDALDLVIRAVRAGVPVHRALQTAGEELTGPVGSECRRIGDALRLGVDQKEALMAARRRISVPEFQFFAVCLDLQRETGGQLSETLENLATIIRSRTEMRMKTRALTAEARMAAKVIGAIPVFTTGGLYWMSGGYLDVLFYTRAGHHLLAAAIGMVVVGQVIIARMSKLEG